MTQRCHQLSRLTLFVFGSSYDPIYWHLDYYSPCYDNRTVSSLWTCISGSQSALPALPFPHSMSASPLCIDLAAAWCYPLASSTSASHCLAAHSDWWSLSSCIYSLPSFSRIFPLPPSSSPLILPREARIFSSKQTVSGVPVLNIVYIHFLTNFFNLNL